MLETRTYTRKTFVVEVVHVEAGNMGEVAAWCGGEVVTRGDVTFVKVPVKVPQSERQTEAHEGEWVLLSVGSGYKVYSDKAFHRSFERPQVGAETPTVVNNVFHQNEDAPRRPRTRTPSLGVSREEHRIPGFGVGEAVIPSGGTSGANPGGAQGH